MYDCETNKVENTSSMYDEQDKKKEETVNASDGETVNAYNYYFSIYECGKYLPIDLQTSMNVIVLYQGSIH